MQKPTDVYFHSRLTKGVGWWFFLFLLRFYFYFYFYFYSYFYFNEGLAMVNYYIRRTFHPTYAEQTQQILA